MGKPRKLFIEENSDFTDTTETEQKVIRLVSIEN